MSGRTRWAVLAALVAVFGLLSGCGLPAGGQPTTIDAKQVPYGLLGPPTNAATVAPSPTATRASQPRIYLVDADHFLVPVPVTLDATRPKVPFRRLGQLLATLERGPTDQQRGQGLSTALSPGVAIRLLALEQGMADIELHATQKDPAPDRLPLVIGQLVLTATSLNGVESVRVIREGKPVEVPLPGGALTSAPLTRSDYDELILRPTATPSAATPGS